MPLIIEVPPEVEARLKMEAERRGETPKAYTDALSRALRELVRATAGKAPTDQFWIELNHRLPSSWMLEEDKTAQSVRNYFRHVAILMNFKTSDKAAGRRYTVRGRNLLAAEAAQSPQTLIEPDPSEAAADPAILAEDLAELLEAADRLEVPTRAQQAQQPPSAFGQALTEKYRRQGFNL